MKRGILSVLLVFTLLCGFSTPAFAETKYDMNETYRVLQIMFEDFITAVKELDVTDQEIADFLVDLNAEVDKIEGLNASNFNSRMYNALYEVLFSGAHNNLMIAINAQYDTVIQSMLETRQVPAELMPLRNAVMYCVLGEGEIQLFDDVAVEHWAREYIEFLAVKGVINGMGGGAFAPEQPVTREQFVKMIVDATGIGTSDSTVDLNDLAVGEWYYPYVASAYQNGYVSGVGNGQFGLGMPITRQDMAVMLYNVMQKRGLSLAGEESAFDGLKDKNVVSPYAKEAVRTLCGGMLTGDENGMFNPTDSLTRSQAARVIYVLYGLING